MKLAYWMYAGPAHIGTLRIASSFKNVHAIMHAPLGDDYFNVMRSMLERKRDYTPVTASVVDRHVLAQGSQEKVINNISRKSKEQHPDLLLLTPTCTSSILQEDLQNFVNRASFQIDSDVILADVNHYRVNEMQAADRTLEQIITFYIKKAIKQNNLDLEKTITPSVNIIGAFNLGFHNQHDIAELKKFFSDLNIKVNLILPEGLSVDKIKYLPKAWFNFVPYREIGLLTAKFLEKQFMMPYLSITPMGITEITKSIREIQKILLNLGHKCNYEEFIQKQTRFISQSSWFSRSIDCQNLTGKKVVVFGDSTHAAAITKLLSREMGINVLWSGTFCKHDEIWFRKEVKDFCDEILITDDHNLVGNMIAKSDPSAIFGTQMERHVGKRLNIPCGVISSPVHIQNFPLSYRPFLGYEGANQIADLIYNSFMLGMEDHLLDLFGGHDTNDVMTQSLSNNNLLRWSEDSIKELQKIPGFIRNKVKKNIEKFAYKKSINIITLEVMYAAKEDEN